MYVVTVKFYVKPSCREDFLSAMIKQASDSLSLEKNCTYFDVNVSEKDPNLIFLYEIYTSKDAFSAHLKSNHFISFSEKVSDWVENKTVENFVRA